jgi:hypothetical protein
MNLKNHPDNRQASVHVFDNHPTLVETDYESVRETSEQSGSLRPHPNPELGACTLSSQVL